ncbi:MFS transporter [Prevotella sp.]|uniref:MFS transporter n=1 Tax=Prevotella sp. TaxID=59823 RepID=UPI002F91F0EC
MNTNSPRHERSYLLPFLSMVLLFFIVGFLTTANAQFQAPLRSAFLSQVGGMKNSLVTLITFSWFLAYPLTGPLGARWVDRHGYKSTLIRGLMVMAVGLGLFSLSSIVTSAWPSSMVCIGSGAIPVGFFVFLLGSFVAGASATILQVVINPYLVACEVRHTQGVQRMAMGGTANSIGTTLAPYFVSGIIFGGLSVEEVSVDRLTWPFLILMSFIIILILVLSRFSLPDIQKAHVARGEKLKESVWSFSHLTLGVVAIFFYVGCEVCIGGNINLYVISDLHGSVASATLMATLYWGGLLVGRLISSMLSKVSPRAQLTFTTTAAIALVTAAMLTDNPWLLIAVGLCHSIMWGCIYTLAVAHLGKYMSAASGVFMIGVIGGAVLPLVQGIMADGLGSWRWSWSIVLVGEVCMLAYALVGSRIYKTADE